MTRRLARGDMARSAQDRRFGRWHSIVAACLALLAPSPAGALDHVTLQLKWKHQFQFAGYYAALDKGFYRDAGLDVEIHEGAPDIDAAQAMATGDADFGVCTSSVLLDRAKGRDLVVLAVIFQHSAAVILVPRRAGVATLSELKGHRLMDAPGSDDIAAMLKREGVDYASLPRVAHNDDPHDLFDAKADAMIAYSTNEPFVLDRLGMSYQTFSPRAYGIDFYGDSLCTSMRQVRAHPDRTRALTAASLKGWQYALYEGGCNERDPRRLRLGPQSAGHTCRRPPGAPSRRRSAMMRAFGKSGPHAAVDGPRNDRRSHLTLPSDKLG
jgi:ABC-type nitrate/sulfonate/bicarbonate transport system substrate-binding protein